MTAQTHKPAKRTQYVYALYQQTVRKLATIFKSYNIGVSDKPINTPRSLLKHPKAYKAICGVVCVRSVNIVTSERQREQ